MASAAKAYEALAGSGKLAAGDKLKMVESIAGGYYRNKEYAKAVEWAQRYVRDGGNSSQMQTLLIQAQYLSGDTAGVTKELMAEIQADEKAGKAPSEDRLKLLMNATARQPEGGGADAFVHISDVERSGMSTLRDAGLRAIFNGHTTLEEIIKYT